MPFAICRRCRAVFIVGTNEENTRAPHLCPQCGGALEPLGPEEQDELLRRIQKERPRNDRRPNQEGFPPCGSGKEWTLQGAGLPEVAAALSGRAGHLPAAR